MKYFQKILCFFLLSFVVLLSNISSPMQSFASPETERKAQEIYDTVMSPFCPGRTLSACPSSDARDLRQKIELWLEQGISLTQVKTMLVEQYGVSLLGTPSMEGFGLLAWMLPGLFLFVGAVIIVFWIKRGMSSRSQKEIRGGEFRGKNKSFESEIDREVRERLVG